MKGQKLNKGDQVLINLYVGCGKRELKEGIVHEIHEDRPDFFKVRISQGVINKWFNTTHSNVILKN